MIKSEWQLIARINKKLSISNSIKDSKLIKGIGDDCAVYQTGKSQYMLISTDMSVEKVHFSLKFSTLKEIGYKAMAGNISDIAAMGGSPSMAFVSLGIPEKFNESEILKIYDGFIDASKNSNLQITGGDTSKSSMLTIAISIIGFRNKIPFFRDGAKIGDSIFVTGNLGNSLAGLKILQKKNRPKKEELALIKKHKTPKSRENYISFIENNFSVNSMIDISDGLLSDLRHICNASKKGFLLKQDTLPLSNHFITYCKTNKFNPYDFALKSGEEYELIFTGKNKKNIIDKNFQITKIGEIVEKGFWIEEDNKKRKVEISGYDHFKK